MHLRKFLLTALLLLVVALPISGSVNAEASLPVTGEVAVIPDDASIATNLTEFIGLVKNGNADTLVGVFVPEILALPVAQQPSGNASYVSEQPNVVTQFRMASEYGTTGLLAHNTLSGALFFNINVGDQVVLVYGDGLTRQYQVTRIDSFQALSPANPYSDFLDLSTADRRLTAAELFGEVYRGGDQVIFQTCIAGDGDPSWGRLFITAE
ncbi:MAG TPA: hypothetical protein VHO48_06725, partial [Anaerolineaceae bacterium]|nr:hypothetical protein [Anaerolineaceae bacterium]